MEGWCGNMFIEEGFVRVGCRFLLVVSVDVFVMFGMDGMGMR